MMIVLVGTAIGMALGGLVAAPILAYRGHVLPALARRGAGPAAHVIAAVPVILALGLGAWLLTGWFIGWRAVHPGPVALALLLLLLIGNDGDFLASLPVSGAPADAGRPAHAPTPPQHLRARAGLAMAAVAVFTAVAVPLVLRPIEEGWACTGVALAVPTRAPRHPGDPPPIQSSLSVEPEPGAVFAWSEAYTVETAAESRHDPRSLQQLLDSGWIAGYRREWETADDTWITADVFEFASGEGAIRYQRAVNRYACPDANAFAAPREGIGLQLEREEGWIEDQVSWVSDTRRYRVSVFHTLAPLDHARILAIVDRVMASTEH